MAEESKEYDEVRIERAVQDVFERGHNSEPRAVCDGGRARPVKKKHSLKMKTLADYEEKEPEWLIPGWIPKYAITIFAGDGGSCKTSTWCHIISKLSAGKFTIFERELEQAGVEPPPPLKVMFFSSEDSVEYTLKNRMMKNDARFENVVTIDYEDERFIDIRLNSKLLEDLIQEYRPELIVFDPLQSFIPEDVNMGQRNAMRWCMSPLLAMGLRYKTTFIIIMHTNKQAGLYSRKRIADSADMWDIARSVIMLGETDQRPIRYITHEKCNYGELQKSILFKLTNGQLEFINYSDKHDKEFITEHDYSVRVKPALESAKDFIMEFLEDGEKEAEELLEAAKANGISKQTFEVARRELRKSGLIATYRPPGSKKWLWMKK